MSDERSHHVTLNLARDYEFVADFDDVPGAPSIMFDEPEPLGGNRAPNAAAVLGAAVGNCLSASLAFCLRKAHVPVDGLTARVTTRTKKNEKGRFRITGIEVELSPEVARTDTARLRRCEELFEDFCIVTESVRRGIPVSVSIREAEGSGEPAVASVGAAVASALTREPALNGAQIEVDTASGRVILMGLAPDPLARARAAEVAAQVDGVAVVQNQLRVASLR